MTNESDNKFSPWDSFWSRLQAHQAETGQQFELVLGDDGAVIGIQPVTETQHPESQETDPTNVLRFDSRHFS